MPKEEKSVKRRNRAGTENIAKLKREAVGDFVKRSMFIYGSEVNEDRAIPSYQDGLKPVQRRLLWAASKVATTKVKSAMPVAEAMGKYHPHGDSSLYGALTNMVNNNTPLMIGLGNWGSLVDLPAAMRYTNTLISRYGAEFLRKEYLAVTPRVPNYDSTLTEPLYLPALLPNIFMNPTSGIGVGMGTEIPGYTPASLIRMCIRILDREELTAMDWVKGLEFHSPWGSKLVSSKENRKALKSFYETGSGSIAFYAPVGYDEARKQLSIKYFTPGVRIESSDKKRNEKQVASKDGKEGKKSKDKGLGLVDKIRRMSSVSSIYTDGGLSFVVQLRKDLNTNECKAMHAKVQNMLTAKQSFNLFTTKRKAAPEEKYEVSFVNESLPNILMRWLRFRLALEVRSLKWRINEQEIAIAYTELLIHVCSDLQKLIEILERRLKDKDELRRAVAKAYKISEEQASQILELRVYQLSRVDLDQQAIKLKEQQAHLKSLQRMLKNPVAVVRDYLDGMKDRFVLINDTNPQQWQWGLSTK